MYPSGFNPYRREKDFFWEKEGWGAEIIALPQGVRQEAMYANEGKGPFREDLYKRLVSYPALKGGASCFTGR